MKDKTTQSIEARIIAMLTKRYNQHQAESVQKPFWFLTKGEIKFRVCFN